MGGDWLSFLELSFDKPTRQNQILEGKNHLWSSQALNQTGFKSTRLVWTGGLDILLSSQKKKICGCHSFDQVQFYMFNIVSTPILILDINFDFFIFKVVNASSHVAPNCQSQLSAFPFFGAYNIVYKISVYPLTKCYHSIVNNDQQRT